VAFFFESCVPENVVPKSPYIHTISSKNGSLFLWSLDNIYTVQNDFEPMMDASTGLLCILGDVVYPPKMGLSCIDSSNGKTNWQKYIGVPTAILTTPSGIYVTYGSRPGIEKYNFVGTLTWLRSFMGTGILYIYPYENQIQLFMDPERFVALDMNTGETIEDFNSNEEVIFSTTTESFVLSSGIDSKSPDLNLLNWHSEIRDVIRQAPVFTNNFVFLRTGLVVGTLFAIDRKTGQVIWRTENNVVSNAVILPDSNRVIFLTQYGKLLAADQNSGSQTLLADFSQTPLILNGDGIAGGYELAFDKSNGILFVLLGDSRQLFAVKLQQE
jgi:outer membrane protein assembly factor BamB